MSVREIIEGIRDDIENECVSYGGIIYLQAHQDEVLEMGDPVLAEWAGIPEEKFNNYRKDEK